MQAIENAIPARIAQQAPFVRSWQFVTDASDAPGTTVTVITVEVPVAATVKELLVSRSMLSSLGAQLIVEGSIDGTEFVPLQTISSNTRVSWSSLTPFVRFKVSFPAASTLSAGMLVTYVQFAAFDQR